MNKVSAEIISANCIYIRTGDGVYLQSYGVIVAHITSGGDTILDTKYWHYSNGTSKHRNKFLRETSAETAKKLASGVYKLADLN